MSKLLEQLKRHEGFRQHVYKDTMGFDTIGYGYCLPKNPLKLTDNEINIYRREGIKESVASYILQRCIDELRKTLLVKIEGFADLDDVRQDVLINMALNLGVSGLMKFRNTLTAIKHGEYKMASLEMLDSVWAKQVKGRANELALQMRNGAYRK
jgi:lysozyme